tara:strand:- start:50 stop:190 length:141 start_codon:yes stop_codon:yes gene_type:complete
MAAKNKLSTPYWDKKNKIDKYLQNDQKLREKFKWVNNPNVELDHNV